MRYLLIFISLFTFACTSQSQSKADMKRAEKKNPGIFVDLNGNKIDQLRLSNEEWKKQLTDDEYYILRENGTERAFTSELLKEKRKGVFTCAACQLPLFRSETKFVSGTGWPSFFEPYAENHILEVEDRKYGMVRTEVRCARCDGHQGHVFNDGPQPTGQRYCINGDALDFVAAK